jgi:hypothetical protein
MKKLAAFSVFGAVLAAGLPGQAMAVDIVTVQCSIFNPSQVVFAIQASAEVTRQSLSLNIAHKARPGQHGPARSPPVKMQKSGFDPSVNVRFRHSSHGEHYRRGALDSVKDAEHQLCRREGASLTESSRSQNSPP